LPHHPVQRMQRASHFSPLLPCIFKLAMWWATCAYSSWQRGGEPVPVMRLHAADSSSSTALSCRNIFITINASESVDVCEPVCRVCGQCSSVHNVAAYNAQHFCCKAATNQKSTLTSAAKQCSGCPRCTSTSLLAGTCHGARVLFESEYARRYLHDHRR
jgi:hypothetical protein